jgi:GlcNAc-PI de-N-acetylase
MDFATDPTPQPIRQLVDHLGRAPLVLLAVWAHPDDESFLAGGLMAEIARRGGRAVNVTATSGEHGTDALGATPARVLAARRRDELAAALETPSLDDDLLEQKRRALSRHGSQLGPVEAALGPEGLRALAATESYGAANAVARGLLTGSASLVA